MGHGFHIYIVLKPVNPTFSSQYNFSFFFDHPFFFQNFSLLNSHVCWCQATTGPSSAVSPPPSSAVSPWCWLQLNRGGQATTGLEEMWRKGGFHQVPGYDRVEVQFGLNNWELWESPPAVGMWDPTGTAPVIGTTNYVQFGFGTFAPILGAISDVLPGRPPGGEKDA